MHIFFEGRLTQLVHRFCRVYLIEPWEADILNQINMDDNLGCLMSTNYRSTYQAVKYALQEMAQAPSCRSTAVTFSATEAFLKYITELYSFSKLRIIFCIHLSV